MAVQTAAATYRESLGSLTLLVFNFTSVTGADTFVSGLPNVIGYWAVSHFNGGTTTTGNGISVVNSSGTFTFCLGTAATNVDLYVITRT